MLRLPGGAAADVRRDMLWALEVADEPRAHTREARDVRGTFSLRSRPPAEGAIVQLVFFFPLEAGSGLAGAGGPIRVSSNSRGIFFCPNGSPRLQPCWPGRSESPMRC